MGFRLANVDGRAALVHGDRYTDLATHSQGALSPDPMQALGRPDLLNELSAQLDDASATGLLADVTLGPPVPRPQKIFGIGLNYATHVAESGMETPSNPVVFTKFPSCLTGPTGDVEIRSGGCDYEVELVVVIGRGGRDISPDDAWAHVVGVTVGQDISVGPVVVSTDQLVERDALHLTCEINGETRQDGTTADLIFDVPTLISYLSSITTLTTGDLIFTGTPDGVGAAQGKFLADGDIITTTIDGIGTMTNRVVRTSDPRPIGG
jgi:2,4-diketo-3-deoxy-L-fuconate hydrolase